MTSKEDSDKAETGTQPILPLTYTKKAQIVAISC